jgi:signal transduction histidine kinase
VIEIQDSGCGMDLEFITNRLFKPFDTTKGNAGMGMGAYESRQYVQELGGEITVKSTVGEGTLVTLHLPLSEHNADLVNLRL